MVAAALLGGCVVESSPPRPPPDTEIGFAPGLNLGQACGAQLTGWQATMREDGSTVTGGCGDELIFGALRPNTQYTFDIEGFVGARLCWQGSCGVPTQGGIRTYGDCSAQIQHLCGF
ncbi:MAG TPA: hypothetical protein VIF09_22390 [Polyangiaceae bacterium]